MESKLIKILFVLFALGNVASASAEDAPDWKSDTLTGDWGGLRTSLYDKGVTVEITHKSDLLSNRSGGLQTGSAKISNTEAALTFDLEKLAGLGGTTAFVQYHAQHWNQAKDFNGSYVGSFAGVSNIETGFNNSQFWQAWLEKSYEDTLSVLFGLYSIDSEFIVTETSGLFLQPPYGVPAATAQIGKNGPPIFPTGALGLRVKYSMSDFYLQGALTDGVPGDPNSPHGTHIQLNKGDGSLSIVEFGYMPSEKNIVNKTAFGVWNYTAQAADMVTGDPRPDRGFYLLAERTLMAEPGQAGQGLSGFVRYGSVNKDVYPVDWSGSVGLHYQGLFDGRDDDEAGIAVVTSHASSNQQLAGSDSSETAIELTYRAQLLPWMAVQPSFQRIMNPNMDKAVNDATVAAVRFEVAL